MKSCLIMFFGLPRSFEICSENINKMLIDHNKDKCEFTIIISTDKLCNEHEKHKNISTTPIYEKSILENKLNTVYKNIKKILYLNGPLYHYSKCGLKIPTIFYERLGQLLEFEKNNTYDYYIYSRLDIILQQPIDLSKYSNKFEILSSGPNYGGGGMFYIRDWDFMWIGCKTSFNLWCINMLKYGYAMYSNDSSYYNLLKDNIYICNDVENFNNISNKQIENNINKYNVFLGNSPNNKIGYYCYYYVKLFHRLIILLEENNCKFIIGNNFTKIIRSF